MLMTMMEPLHTASHLPRVMARALHWATLLTKQSIGRLAKADSLRNATSKIFFFFAFIFIPFFFSNSVVTAEHVGLLLTSSETPAGRCNFFRTTLFFFFNSRWLNSLFGIGDPGGCVVAIG
jgi:hypothetical protein